MTALEIRDDIFSQNTKYLTQNLYFLFIALLYYKKEALKSTQFPLFYHHTCIITAHGRHLAVQSDDVQPSF